MTHECSEERFARDIKDHGMLVRMDNGVYRHLVFTKPTTSNMYFGIVTWPGHLCYYGDMGTYVFCRVEDMLQFFRSDSGRINPQYWAEKIEAADKNSGVQEFSHDVFENAVLNDLDEKLAEREVEGHSPGEQSMIDFREAVKEMVADTEGEPEQTCIQAACEYFPDFYMEHRCHEYTYRYMWCCYALVWAVQQYDKYKAKGGDL